MGSCTKAGAVAAPPLRPESQASICLLPQSPVAAGAGFVAAATPTPVATLADAPADQDIEVPTPLPPLKGSTAAVACGWLHTLALEYGGSVQSWGANQVGGVVVFLFGDVAGWPSELSGPDQHCGGWTGHPRQTANASFACTERRAGPGS